MNTPANTYMPLQAEQLQYAMADNYTELAKMNALCNDGEVHTQEGVVWAYSKKKSAGAILFPAFNEESAGEILDEIVESFRNNGITNAGCWSLRPWSYKHLAARLLARGFQPGWQPCWMALDLDKIKTGYAVPEGLDIKADNKTVTDHLTELPYSGDRGAVSPAVLLAQPATAQRFIATLNGNIAGQSCVFYAPGRHDVAGIYEVGVVPQAREQGIGKAVVTAACLHAKQKGCRYAVLNATGRKMYEDAGFVNVGYGDTWWMTSAAYITNPPTQKAVLLAEATGMGDVARLEQNGSQLNAEALNKPMINKMTLLQLAAHTGQPATADWLTAHGAAYTALDLWNLGWKERAATMLAADPHEVNRRYDELQLTLLHIAAQKNDIGLAKLALEAGADLSLADTAHDSTALGWAYYFERKEIIELIKNYKRK